MGRWVADSQIHLRRVYTFTLFRRHSVRVSIPSYLYVEKQCLSSGADRDEPRLSVRYPPYTQAATQLLGVRSGAIDAPAAAL